MSRQVGLARVQDQGPWVCLIERISGVVLFLYYSIGRVLTLIFSTTSTSFGGQHRTELLQLMAVERLPALTVMSRVIVLHALQILKLRANPRAEYWVRNIFLNSHGDDLSEIKTLTDAKGDYYCMSKLIYDDIKSETVRQDILNHIRKDAAMQLSRRQLGTSLRRPRNNFMAWKKILSDVDDTLLSSGGLYPAGIDKRYPRKVVYPGVLAFYRELDLGTTGPEDWPEHRVGNLVFLSARPHVYKDMSEKSNFAKFEKLRLVGEDGRRGVRIDFVLVVVVVVVVVAVEICSNHHHHHQFLDAYCTIASRRRSCIWKPIYRYK